MTVLLDYGAGNLTSVKLAFEHLGENVLVAQSADQAAGADRIVFPGVGSAASGMAGLRARGFDTLLREAHARGTPLLAICLGMQLIFERSAEDDGVPGLGLLPGTIEPFAFRNPTVKVPHMGWNTMEQPHPHPMLAGIPSSSAFYFVHSYYAAPACPSDIAGTTEYADFRFTSAVSRGSLFATQFHPERSGKTGLQILRNFLTWSPSCCSNA